jgi:hypothetical protein
MYLVLDRRVSLWRAEGKRPSVFIMPPPAALLRRLVTATERFCLGSEPIVVAGSAASDSNESYRRTVERRDPDLDS